MVCLKTPFRLGLKTKKKIFKRLMKVLQALRNYVVVNRKKSTKPFEWFVLQRSQNIPIDGSMLQEKGLSFAEKLEIPEFNASDGWLYKWKKG